jgi:hypothetical protein
MPDLSIWTGYLARPSRAITRFYGCDPGDVRLFAPSMIEMMTIETRDGLERDPSAILMESVRQPTAERHL